MIRRFFIPTLFALLVTARAGQDLITLTLLPGTSIQGNPGDTIGWGYSITNTSADFLLPLNLDAGSFPIRHDAAKYFRFSRGGAKLDCDARLSLRSSPGLVLPRPAGFTRSPLTPPWSRELL